MQIHLLEVLKVQESALPAQEETRRIPPTGSLHQNQARNSGPRMLIALENFEYVGKGWVARLPLASETPNGA